MGSLRKSPLRRWTPRMNADVSERRGPRRICFVLLMRTGAAIARSGERAANERPRAPPRPRCAPRTNARNAPVARREENPKSFPVSRPQKPLFHQNRCAISRHRRSGGIRVEGVCAMGMDIVRLCILFMLRSGAVEIPRLHAPAHADL